MQGLQEIELKDLFFFEGFISRREVSLELGVVIFLTPWGEPACNRKQHGGKQNQEMKRNMLANVALASMFFF